MPDHDRFAIAGVPFPIGVEYYRGPVPKPEVWDEDFARIAAAGMQVVRSFSFWNHMEPRPGMYELDDFDRMFDLAHKHGLQVWLDLTLATHGTCPEWLLREHPDIVQLDRRGQPAPQHAHPAYPQGGMIHCYDHPAWRQYGGALLRHVIARYKDRPNLLVWGLWDGVSPAWPAHDGGYPCYCRHTIERYKAWLDDRFTLDALNRRLLRRYRRWEDVQPPRDNNNVVEMLLYHQFHYENLVEHLKWMVHETRQIDPVHELRAHAASTPRPWDAACAPEVDSWGMSMPSNNLLTSDDPYTIADRAFSFDWSRSAGRDGRWWNEEIYAGMARGGVTWKKQSDPRELTTLLWMSLACGAAGAMFWQYRPEYLSFEGPGYNLAALDGQPTARFEAVAQAVRQIEGLREHMPLACPAAQVAIVYHSESQDLFGLNNEMRRFNADLRGVYRTLWTADIPADIVTPAMDWSPYRLLFLPNVTLMQDPVRSRIEKTLDENADSQIVAEGSFAMYSADGTSSYEPPEGFAQRLEVRVADFSAVTAFDIEQGRNVVQTPHGPAAITTPCGYAVLEPRGNTRSIATLGNETVAVCTADGRFVWFGLTLSAGFDDVGHPGIVQGIARDAGIAPAIGVEGDHVVPIVRRSARGGRIIFVFNLERQPARARLQAPWRIRSAQDIIAQSTVAVEEDAFEITVDPWEVAVIHCEDA